MTAKYYEYVNEKKKKIQKSGMSRTYNLEFAIYCSTIFTITLPYFR
jgi:hypothetical protein